MTKIQNLSLSLSVSLSLSLSLARSLSSLRKREVVFRMKASDGSRRQLTESAGKKDLGVLVDNQLSFKNHVATITSKARTYAWHHKEKI